MLSNKVLYIRDLIDCPPSYLDDPGRREFFEIVWLKNEKALHVPQHSFQTLQGDRGNLPRAWGNCRKPNFQKHLSKKE